MTELTDARNKSPCALIIPRSHVLLGDHARLRPACKFRLIRQIVGGKWAITADTTLRLGKYFGVSPELWLDLQSDYDLRVMRRTTWPKIEPKIRVPAA